MNNEINNEINAIVDESIRHVICIDDDYVEPFKCLDMSSPKTTGETEILRRRIQFSRDMHCSLRKTKERYVSIIPFNRDIDMPALKQTMETSDLVVLDWDLVSKDNTDTLMVIKSVIECSIPYLCIYTKNSDSTSILDVIHKYFLGYSKQDVKETVSKAESAGMTRDDFLELLEKGYDSKKVKIDTQNIGLRFRKLGCDSSVFNLNENSELIKLLLGWQNTPLPQEKGIAPEVCMLENEYSEETIQGLKISNSYVFSIFKTSDEAMQYNTDCIIPIISRAIVSAPNSYINGIWTFYTNEIRKAFKKDGSYFDDVSWEAFSHYANKLSHEYDELEMKRFLKNIFVKKLAQQMETDVSTLAPSIVSEMKKVGTAVSVTADNKKEFFKLNAFLNTNFALTNNPHGLTFGDVIRKKDTTSYFMCITALCDCAVHLNEQPLEYYLFLAGKSCESLDALKEAESKEYSFVCVQDATGKKEWLAIKWDPKKLRTFYFSEENRNVKSGKEIIIKSFEGEELRYTYICNISQEYSQRMANAAFSWANRVGVSYANSHKL